MRAFVWGGLALCALCIPIADGSVVAAPRLDDRVFDAGAPDASISWTVPGCGDTSPCMAMHETADVSLGHRVALAARAAEESAENSQTEEMTALDLVLMVLFAVGLIGYQLDRKQRVLRHSALFAAPP